MSVRFPPGFLEDRAGTRWQRRALALSLTPWCLSISAALAQALPTDTAAATPTASASPEAPAPSAALPVSTPVRQSKPAKPVATLPILASSFSALEWAKLNPEQQAALKPLAASWDKLSDAQKRKWISLSTNFKLMSTAEQVKLHERMTQWATLSPRQREQARLNFAEAQQITPQQKSEKWQAYQALSPEEKQKLARSAQPKPPRTALAAQPAPSDKLNRLPIQGKAAPVTLPASGLIINDKTLLTRVPPAGKPASSPTP